MAVPQPCWSPWEACDPRDQKEQSCAGAMPGTQCLHCSAAKSCTSSCMELCCALCVPQAWVRVLELLCCLCGLCRDS